MFHNYVSDVWWAYMVLYSVRYLFKSLGWHLYYQYLKAISKSESSCSNLLILLIENIVVEVLLWGVMEIVILKKTGVALWDLMDD